ncbi:MAG: type III pantothenate kinase [Guyparkeria sp.]
MNCYIDAGNSRIKGRLQRRSRAPDEPFAVQWPAVEGEPGGQAGDRLADALDPHLIDEKGRRPSQIAVASVVDEGRREQLEGALERLCPEARIRWMGVPRKCCNVRVGYPDHHALGVDRFCAMIEAHARADGRAAVVVNAGTAITLDLLDARGNHLGGVILPGVRAQFAGLRQLAPGLSDALDAVPEVGAAETVDPVTRELGLATDTATGLALGQGWMLGATLNQMLGLWTGRLAGEAEEVAVFLSGGDADRLHGLIDPAFSVRLEPDLVLAGLTRLARARR